MTYFMLYTAVLLTAAFLAGAMLACTLRKLFTGNRVPARAEVGGATAAGATAAAGVAGVGREDGIFGARDGAVPASGVLETASQRAAREASAGATVDGPADLQEPEPPAAPTPASAMPASPVSGAVQPVEPASDVLPSPDAGEAPGADGPAVAGASAAAVAAVTAAVTPAAAPPAASIASPAVGEAATAAAVGATGPGEDLTRIRGIDADTSRRLGELGITRYEQLAGLDAREVGHVNSALGTHSNVSRQGWIEQAAILGAGHETYYSRRYALGEIDDVPATGSRAQGGVSEPHPVPDVRRGEDTPAADRNGVGENSGLEEAGQTVVAPVASVDPAPSGDAESLQASAPEAAPVAATDAPGGAANLRSRGTSGLRSTGGAGSPAPGVVRSSEPDDLKRIRGVGVVIERKLHAMGVTTYEQVANWGDEDIANVNGVLDFTGRIERENWIEQARVLGGGGATEFASRVDRGEVDSSKA